MSQLELALQSQVQLAVSHFFVREELNQPFEIWVQTISKQPDISSSGIIDQPLGFLLDHRHVDSGPRIWTGICSHFRQIKAEPTGVSTYLLRIVPTFWRLQQRRNHRTFSKQTLRDIVTTILSEWAIPFQWEAKGDARTKKPFPYKVQYGESDYAFLCRLLEDAGISFVFRQKGSDWPAVDGVSELVFSDKLESGKAYAEAIPFTDNPNPTEAHDYIVNLQLAHDVRPRSYAASDYAFQKPDLKLSALAEASDASAADMHRLYERYHYEPGGLHEGRGDEEDMGNSIEAARRLGAERSGALSLSYETNVIHIPPGVVFNVDNHPLVDSGTKLLARSMQLEGAANGEWDIRGTAVFGDVPFHPPRVTALPRIYSLQTARVTAGPSGVIIDEHGRTGVCFPWDRDAQASCWLRVSQSWAGAGFGMAQWPDAGEEVLVAFLGGDPDQPIIVGRVYNATHIPPYKLPDHHLRSTWRGPALNEITFDDNGGNEFVFVNATKDLYMQLGNERHISLVADSKEKIGGSQHLTVGADAKTDVSGAVSLSTGGDHQLKAGGKHAVDAASEIHLKAGQKVIIEAPLDITLKGQGGFIKIDPVGVTIQGNLVKINCPGGAPGSGSGSSPSAPEAPEIEVEN